MQAMPASQHHCERGGSDFVERRRLSFATALLLAGVLGGCGGDVSKGAGAGGMVSNQELSAIFGAPAGDGGNSDNQPDSNGYYGCTWEPEPGYQDPVQQVNIDFEAASDFTGDESGPGVQRVTGVGQSAFLAPRDATDRNPTLEIHQGISYFLVQVALLPSTSNATEIQDDRRVALDVISYLASHT